VEFLFIGEWVDFRMNQRHFNRLVSMYENAPINQYFNPKMEISLGQSKIEMEISENFHHSGKSLHGSVYFKMLDDAAFFAASSYVDDNFLVTTTFTTYLTRSMSKGVIRSKGEVVNKNNTQIISESVLFDDQNREIARGSGIFVQSKFPLKNALGYSLD